MMSPVETSHYILVIFVIFEKQHFLVTLFMLQTAFLSAIYIIYVFLMYTFLNFISYCLPVIFRTFPTSTHY